jgi:hypothetical protein
MERLPLGDTPYYSIYFRDCTLGMGNRKKLLALTTPLLESKALLGALYVPLIDLFRFHA